MKITVTGLLLVLATLPSFGQQYKSSQDSLKSIEMAKELLRTGPYGEAVLSEIMLVIKQFRVKATHVPSDIWDKIEGEVSIERYYDYVAPVYIRHFSYKELKEIRDWNLSEIGIKFNKVYANLSGQMAEAGRLYGTEVGLMISKRLLDYGYTIDPPNK